MCLATSTDHSSVGPQEESRLKADCVLNAISILSSTCPPFLAGFAKVSTWEVVHVMFAVQHSPFGSICNFAHTHVT